MVGRLVKALYGLKQAARSWHEVLTAKMQEDGYDASQHDPCLFMRGQGPTRAYAVVHVDCSTILENNGEDEKVVPDLKQHFDVKVMERVEFFLGQEMEMVPGRGILLHRAQYAWKLLHMYKVSAGLGQGEGGGGLWAGGARSVGGGRGALHGQARVRGVDGGGRGN